MQRRKGNAQCASSSKAAEMLQNTGNFVQLFGIEGLQIPSLEINDISPTEFNSVSPETRVVLKKLSKRDAMTREKGIKEIVEMTQRVSAAELKPIFTCFAMLYPRLVTDGIAMIRLLANSALSNFLKILRKESEGAALKTVVPFLLLSLGDIHAARRSAERLLDECFTGDKRINLFKAFAKSTINLALEIINRKHKFMQPQQGNNDETDEQRQSRLISQSLTTLELLLDENKQLATVLIQNFTQPATITALIIISTNIKVALFSLLKRLIQVDAAPFFDSKILSLILANLDSEEISLSRNAFECFLVLTANERFREECKFEKAVVSKFLAIIRRKSIHWNVLETSLLPSFVLICKLLPEPSCKKWIFSSVDSFFDGELPIFLLMQWATAFVEVLKFSLQTYANDDEILSYLHKKIVKWVEYVVERSPDDEKLHRLAADFIISVSASANDDIELKQNLILIVLNRLPRTNLIVVLLLSLWDDNTFLSKLLNCDDISDELIVQAFEKDADFATKSVPNVGDFLLRRICDSSIHKVKLLQILCDLICAGKVENLLVSFAKDDAKNCLLFAEILPAKLVKIFNADTRAYIIMQIVDGLLTRLLSTFDGSSRHLVGWLIEMEQFSTQEDQICASILTACAKTSGLSDFSLRLYDGFFTAKKIEENQEKIISAKIFECLIANDASGITDVGLARDLLNRLQIDLDQSINLLNRLFSSSSIDYPRISKIAKTFTTLKFANISLKDFHPTKFDVNVVANTFERQFLLDVLLGEESFFFSFVPVRPALFNAISPNCCTDTLVTSVFDYLHACAKRAIFLQKIGGTDLSPATRAFVWLTTTFVDFFCRLTFSKESRDTLAQFLDDLNRVEVREDYLLEVTDLFLSSENDAAEEMCIPISLIYAIRMLEKSGVDLAKLNEFLKFTVVKRCPSLSFAFALNFSASNAELPILATAHVKFEAVKANDEQTRIRGWIYEFERACATFTAENRAEHYVKLAMFVENKEYNEWLFTFQGDNAVRDALSCVLLRFCSKVAPYMAEVDGPIRDFINCGFITAFQSCTDNILSLKSAAGNRNLLLFVLAQLCLELFIIYENCIILNTNNADYADIKQEWNEFFSPSAVNFIFSWFLNLTKDQDLYPSGFLLRLCRLIHFIDARRLFGAELLLGLADKVDFKALSDAYFQKYPTDRCNILCATATLLISEKAEIQLAAAKVLQSNLTFMFDHENTPPAVDESLVASSTLQQCVPEGYDFEGGADIGDEDSHTQVNVPQFLAAALQCKYPMKESRKYREYPIPIVLLSWEAFVRFISDDSLDTSSRVLICDAFSTRIVDAALERLLAALPDPPHSSQSKEGDVIFSIDANPFRMSVFDYEKLACNLYYRSLISVPALVRQWYLSLGKSIALVINGYTRKYVSEAVMRHEISRIGDASARRFGRLDVRVLGTMNEVIAGYHFSDTSISLHIALPDDFPLSLVTITAQRKIVRENLHRKWLLQLEKFLGHENGSLLDGIMQWKQNIDKHLEGVKDCIICMLTISLTNHQLPRIRCRQCRNKFHGDCLYKWFKTSSNTSCPLCRANFIR